MTSRSYQKVSLSQMKGKTATEEEPPLGSNFNRWTDQHLQGKAIANTGSFRRDQPPTFLPTSAKHSALPKRKPGQLPELGTVFSFFRVTSRSIKTAPFTEQRPERQTCTRWKATHTSAVPAKRANRPSLRPSL